MNIGEFLLYCACCRDLVHWEGETTTKIRCSCGESGGKHQSMYVADNTPWMQFFDIWGDCTPVRIEQMEKASDAIAGNTPLFGKEFFGKVRIFTEKSMDTIIQRYDDEEEFETNVDYDHSVDPDPNED